MRNDVCYRHAGKYALIYTRVSSPYAAVCECAKSMRRHCAVKSRVGSRPGSTIPSTRARQYCEAIRRHDPFFEGGRFKPQMKKVCARCFSRFLWLVYWLLVVFVHAEQTLKQGYNSCTNTRNKIRLRESNKTLLRHALDTCVSVARLSTDTHCVLCVELLCFWKAWCFVCVRVFVCKQCTVVFADTLSRR